jgi:hypothetical protein
MPKVSYRYCYSLHVYAAAACHQVTTLNHDSKLHDRGKYSTDSGQIVCSAISKAGIKPKGLCKPGRYGTGAMKEDPKLKLRFRDCRMCNKGRYSGGGRLGCMSCPLGYFQTVIGQSTCTPCGRGRYTPTFSCTKSSKNPACHLYDNDPFFHKARFQCSACPSGKYSLDGKACKVCPSGKVRSGMCQGSSAGMHSGKVAV